MPYLSDAVQLAADTLRDHPERWTQDVLYRNVRGSADDTDAEAACSACALGQIGVAASVIGYRFDPLGYDDSSDDEATLDDIARELFGYDGLADYNDERGRTPRQVAGALDEIAGTLRQDGQ